MGKGAVLSFHPLGFKHHPQVLVYLYEIISNYQISYSSTKPLAEVMISNHLRSLQSNPMTWGPGIEIINLLNQKGFWMATSSLDIQIAPEVNGVKWHGDSYSYIFPRSQIPPEIGCFWYILRVQSYLFSRCLDVWDVIWKSLHPLFLRYS